MINSRQLALLALREIEQRQAYTDLALERVCQKYPQINAQERGLTYELVYGITRRKRTLDQLINQLGKKQAHQQPQDLRLILYIGLYQLRYLEHIPVAAAVDTTVELAKQNEFKALAGVVNGILRQYLRLSEKGKDILQYPEELVTKLGIIHSYPDWLISNWLQQFGLEETEQLCLYFNQPAPIDLRVNILKTSVTEVELLLKNEGLTVSRVGNLPQVLRLTGKIGSVEKLPGFQEGWWMIQDSSAQLVSHLLEPQGGETIVDACAAPGGKTCHLAELMGDRGVIWACDLYPARLKKLEKNRERLQLKSIRILTGDSRKLSQFAQNIDRVLLDVPCSGLGTLHKRPDLRWKQNPQTIAQLTQLQGELLTACANWVKPGGVLVYATCTINPVENERIIETFLQKNANWQMALPPPWFNIYTTEMGGIKVLPTKHNMDGFFMIKLQKNC